MASQMQKSAVKSLDKAEFVVQSTKTAKSSVTANLNQVFQPVQAGAGEGSSIPDWDVAQEANAELLSYAGGEVRRTDEVFRSYQVEVSNVGSQRRTEMEQTQGRHSDLRRSIQGAYGKEALPLVGLDAPPALSFPGAREQGTKVVGRMRSPDLIARLPEVRPGQEPLKFEDLANAHETQVRALANAIEEYKRMRKLADQAFVAKEEALAFHRRVYVNVTRIQEAYYRLAGFDELASRIRVAESTRRPAAPDESPEPPPSSPPEEEAPATA